MALNTFLIGGAAALVAISFIPFALPGSVHVERSAVIDAQPDALFDLISSNKGYQTFNPYKSSDPNLNITLHGPDQGIGSGFDFKGKDGTGTQVVSALEENRSVTMAIDLGFMGKPTQKFELIPVTNGTKVVWGMDMEFGMNPIGRVMGRFMDGMVGSTFEVGLKNLADAVAKPA